MTDRELLELAAKAAGLPAIRWLGDDVRSIGYAPGERENAAQTLKAAKDAAFEQAANLVELEYAPDAKAGKRLAQIAQHIRDLKKRSS